MQRCQPSTIQLYAFKLPYGLYYLIITAINSELLLYNTTYFLSPWSYAFSSDALTLKENLKGDGKFQMLKIKADDV